MLWFTCAADMLYFANKDVDPNPLHVDNVYQYQDPRVELDNEGYAVQATAYALMVYSELAPDNVSGMSDSACCWMAVTV